MQGQYVSAYTRFQCCLKIALVTLKFLPFMYRFLMSPQRICTIKLIVTYVTQMLDSAVNVPLVLIQAKYPSKLATTFVTRVFHSFVKSFYMSIQVVLSRGLKTTLVA